MTTNWIYMGFVSYLFKVCPIYRRKQGLGRSFEEALPRGFIVEDPKKIINLNETY